MSSKESQRDEICALESIYNEEEIQTHEENGLLGGQFYAYIELPAGFRVVFRDLRKEGWKKTLLNHVNISGESKRVT